MLYREKIKFKCGELIMTESVLNDDFVIGEVEDIARFARKCRGALMMGQQVLLKLLGTIPAIRWCYCSAMIILAY